MRTPILLVFLIALFLAGCGPQAIPTPSPPVEGITDTPTTNKSIPDPQITKTTFILINPLTGLGVEDEKLLELPAVLVSISHFPVTARPQAGLSFAPFVFEIYITEGATRFLTTFYGQFPARENPITGHCNIRIEPIQDTETLIGNRVWFDRNGNNHQDDWEQGVGGVCVNLYDKDLNLLEQTSTDSNGYYGFDVSQGEYFLAFDHPYGLEFARMNVGDEEKDSDVNPGSGYIEAVKITSPRLDLDVGLVPSENFKQPSTTIPELVGPVRSGRLVYADIAEYFPGSCLIFAYASSEVLPELPKCAYVDHIIQGGGYMLDVSRMTQLANERKDSNTIRNYTSNFFSVEPPEDGIPGTQLEVFIAYLNQAAWLYDEASHSYWRYVDEADESTAGILHPEIDRLTGRQLQFENVIVLFAVHDVISPTNLDIRMGTGRTGHALLFRDGMMYAIQWAVEEDKPIQFQFKNGDPFPLKPGHTWITVVTPETKVTEKNTGQWFLRFIQPKGAK